MFTYFKFFLLLLETTELFQILLSVFFLILFDEGEKQLKYSF